MSEISALQAVVVPRRWTVTQLALHGRAVAIALSRKVGLWSMRMLRVGANLALSAASRIGRATAAIRLPVGHAAYMRVSQQLERFEAEAIASVRRIECREKRTRALLALARTAHEIGRDNQAFLKAILAELQVEHYWQRKQARIFVAAQLACSTAGLAAMSGHPVIGGDAYLCSQQYNGKISDVDRKIGMAAAFADVAALLEAAYDRVVWLQTAMDLACGIADAGGRAGAVNFVARKMVMNRIPPCDNHVVDKRFAVDASAMARKSANDAASQPIMPNAGQGDLGFGVL